MPDLTERDLKFQQYFTLLAPQYAHLTSNTTYDLLLQAFNGPLKPRLSSLLTSSDSVTVHDNASGPGTATSALLTFCRNANLPMPNVHATDYTEAMIDALQRQILSQGWTKVNARVADSQALDFEDNTFHLSIVNFSIANFAHTELAIKEVYRTLKADGTAIVSNWETFGFSTILDAAIKKVRPNARPLPVAGPEFMQEDILVKTLVNAGFEKDKVQVYQTKLVLSDDERLASISDFMKGRILGLWLRLCRKMRRKNGPQLLLRRSRRPKSPMVE